MTLQRAPRPTLSPASPAAALPLIVHSHLRWGPGAERPRQLFSRLAHHHPVLFIEPPMFGAIDRASLQCGEPHPNVLRVVPVLPLSLRGGEDVCRAATATLVQAWLDGSVEARPTAGQSAYDPITRAGPPRTDRFRAAVQWFCTPMDSPAFIGRFATRGAVYDRAAALTHPQRSLPGFAERDHQLIRQATLVFYSADAELIARLPRPRLIARSVAQTGSADTHPAVRAHARRAAWDGLADAVRARLLTRFSGDTRPSLAPAFLAASAQAFGLH